MGTSHGIAIGASSMIGASYCIQLGQGYNGIANTFSVGLSSSNNYRLLDADGTIPADRLPNAINKYSTMPTAASTNVGWIVQFTGTTDSTYTHGYIYECKAQGTDPETYAWEAVEVQAGGGSGLPSQTGNAGKFLTTDGTDASWSDKPLVNADETGKGLSILGTVDNIGAGGVGVGSGSKTYKWGVAIGASTRVTALNAVAIGFQHRRKPEGL
jgi:hypothetical protein